MNADAISRIKAVRGHHSCQTPQRFNHRRSVAQKKNVPFGLLGCGNFRTSSKGTVARVLLRYRLRNVTSDSTCCRRRRRGMSPAGLSCAPWLLFQSPDGVHPTEQSRRLRVTRAQTHTALAYTHKYSHIQTHKHA